MEGSGGDPARASKVASRYQPAPRLTCPARCHPGDHRGVDVMLAELLKGCGFYILFCILALIPLTILHIVLGITIESLAVAALSN
jgi:hypothetical protein